MRLALAAQGLTSAEIDDLMPSDSPIVPPPLPEIAGLYPLQRPPAPNRHAGLGAIEELIGSGASNNWVVSGARTRSGKPLLANDPHLRLAAPAIWYLAHLALEQPGASTVNVVGATLPGCRWSCSAAAIRWPGASPTPAPTCRTCSSRRSTPTTPRNT